MDLLINDGWMFKKMQPGSTFDAMKDPSGWQAVDLPHDWLIWQENDLYESADAWYCRELEIPENHAPVMLLQFDGVYMDCDVWLNGHMICSHAYGYTAFTADLSGKIKAGTNRIYVHIRHQSPNSRWYSGSGIFRDVKLVCLPQDYIVPYSFAISEKKTGDGWKVSLSAETHGTDRGLFQCRITDEQGTQLAEGSASGIEHAIHTEFEMAAQAWSIEDPKLYQLHYTYGKQTGVLKFGLRETTFDPDHGFFLNGKPVKLHGVCLHHDLGALGSAFHEKAARRQLKLMKDMGVNAIRTSHNPPAEKLLDLCDEMGILVVDEAFDMWERPKTTYDYARFFDENEAEDVASWVRRDRCHPSVIMWSIGNEIYDMHADMRGTEVTRMLKEQVEKHDPGHHGAVTFGCNYMPWEGGQRCAEIVKTAGYNYGEKLYESHHRQHPDWVIYGSETASVLASRNIYHFPIEQSVMSEADQQCSALGNSNTSWGALDLKSMIVDDLKCGYSMGQFIWSGIDYIGEPTPYHTRSCYFGQADTACFPKDPYYLFRSLWSDRPTLHIGVYWDWNPGQLIDIPVMTNCAEAELLLNGKTCGRKRVSADDAEKCLPVWKIPYEPGTLEAIGYNVDGQEIMRDVRVTPEDTDHFVLQCEDEYLLSDGWDLSFVRICAADRNGNPVDNARDRVHISVSGGGCLMGTDNGDSTDPDGYKSNDRRLFGGKLLAIIGSSGIREDVKISVTSADGKCSELTIPVQASEIRQGQSRVMRIPDHARNIRRPIRKIEIAAVHGNKITPDNPECAFDWKYLPENADRQDVTWQVTNAAGIETPYAMVREDQGRVYVTASGDGYFYLRAMTGETESHADLISQIEISAEGVGKPSLDPYRFVSAGLFDLHTGEIGTGNEKGIAFDRENESMAGFSRLDFGKAGSDRITVSIFALDDKPYEIELLDGDPAEGGRLITTLHYEKPSIWNVYQEETYQLPERLTGIRTVCFRMKQKVHMKGFVFEKQSRAFLPLSAGEADQVYGDSFRKDGSSVCEIGNNVTLTFNGMDFGKTRKNRLEIKGKTPLNVNAITVRITGEAGNGVTEIADFSGNGGSVQSFDIQVPGGMCSVSFVFLPGSQFDFDGFRFKKLDT
ncbi:MAG: DUF4982 domain-containing protein [Clostridia bacterium]|nr:DUF4982 domain-containing protein [Clostridia bacterium]